MSHSCVACASVQTLQAPAQSVVWVWGAHEYPHTLFYYIRSRLSGLRSENAHTVCHTVLSIDQGIESLSAQISMTTLGMTYVYWVLDYPELSASVRKKLEYILQEYTGPHTLIVWTGTQEPAVPAHQGSVNLSQAVLTNSDELCCALSSLGLEGVRPSFAQAILDRAKSISLEDCARLALYIGVVGKNSSVFLTNMLDRVIPPDHSLYRCAGAFFARDRATFAKAWRDISGTYGPEFWTVFWSEQCAQAYRFCRARDEYGLPAAKKHTGRLPFSFIQKDHALWSIVSLADALDRIYKADYRIKDGGDLGVLTFVLHDLLS